MRFNSCDSLNTFPRWAGKEMSDLFSLKKGRNIPWWEKRELYKQKEMNF